MNDRFNFKGQTENGKWIYGSLLWYADEPQIWDKEGNNFIVKSETVCQCTGLRDKRHQLIYESDIVTDGYNNMLVYYNRETCSFAMQKRTKYTLKRFGKNGYEVVSLRNLSENHFKNYQLEIIGNEFQNPELLEVNNEHT